MDVGREVQAVWHALCHPRRLSVQAQRSLHCRRDHLLRSKARLCLGRIRPNNSMEPTPRTPAPHRRCGENAGDLRPASCGKTDLRSHRSAGRAVADPGVLPGLSSIPLGSRLLYPLRGSRLTSLSWASWRGRRAPTLPCIPPSLPSNFSPAQAIARRETRVGRSYVGGPGARQCQPPATPWILAPSSIGGGGARPRTEMKWPRV